MKQHKEILEFHHRFDGKAETFSHALLFQISGSTYRKTGSRMLISRSGDYSGGISGGCLESDVQQKAKLNLLLNRSEIITYNTAKDRSGPGANLGCDGVIEVLITPVDASDPNNPVQALAKQSGQRKPVPLITAIRLHRDTSGIKTGNAYTVEELEKIMPEYAAELRAISNQVLENMQSCFFQLAYNDQPIADFFVEYLQPVIQLIAVGDHRDVLPLISMAQILGWKMIVCGRKDRYPTTINSSVSIVENATLDQVETDPYTAVVLMSHNFDADVINLPKMVDKPHFYLGVLGPEKRKRRLLETTKNSHLHQHIAGPIGLRIGSKSPEEIALAVCAEIQQEFAKKFDYRTKTDDQKSVAEHEKKPTIH